MTTSDYFFTVTCAICDAKNPRVGQSFTGEFTEMVGRKTEVTYLQAFNNIPLCDNCIRNIQRSKLLNKRLGNITIGAFAFAIVVMGIVLLLEQLQPNLVTPNSIALIIRNTFCLGPVVVLTIIGILHLISNNNDKLTIKKIESSLHKYGITSYLLNSTGQFNKEQLLNDIGGEMFKLGKLLQQKEALLKEQIMSNSTNIEQTQEVVNNLKNNIQLLHDLQKRL